LTKPEDIGSLIKLKEFCVITFVSTSNALKGEKVMKDADRRFVIMPTPREISTSCGLSIKIKPEDVEESYRILREGGVEVEGVYLLRRDGDKRNVVALHLD